LEVADDIVDPAFQDHPPTRFFDVGRKGPDSLKEAVRHFREGFSDFHDTMIKIEAEGDRVAYLGTISGTHDGEFFGFPATGKPMQVLGINFFRLKDGKIVERWGQFDVLGMMSQLGLAAGPGGPQEHTDLPMNLPEHVSNSIIGEPAPEQAKALYRRMIDEVVHGANYDLADEIFASDYIDHTAPPGMPGGVEGVKGVYRMFRTGFPDVHFHIDDMVAEGDMVATRVTGHGHQTGQFMGIQPTGREATWRSVGFFRVTNGKIIEHWGIPDLLGLLVQLGVIELPEIGTAPPSDE